MTRTKQSTLVIYYGIMVSWYSSYLEKTVYSMLHHNQPGEANTVFLVKEKLVAKEFLAGWLAQKPKSKCKLVEIKVIE